jgi:hypothetical protein
MEAAKGNKWADTKNVLYFSKMKWTDFISPFIVIN